MMFTGQRNVVLGVTPEEIRKRGYILWGADAEGGAPYVFPDPSQPSSLIGFEVELAIAIARELGVGQKMVQNAWDSLIPALERGDFDFAMNGIEITEERMHRVLFSVPYYVYTEQLVVRKDDLSIQSLRDVQGKKVGTLSGAVALSMLKQIEGVDIRVYSGVVEPYQDLALGRLDAVLLDLPIAAFYAKPNPALRFAGPPEGEGFYAIAIRKEDILLKRTLDHILRQLLERGDLKRIYDKWNLWNEHQSRLLDIADKEREQVAKGPSRVPLLSLFPNLLRAAGLTILLSTISMMLAMGLGLLLALTKLYARRFLSWLATAYIEVYRGTPLLIQLYILYYGLPNVGISLSPVFAAILGLGMNYAAYEAELYRAGIQSVSRGQMEAALSLGMSPALAIRRIILPQAFRIALPGVTNDFIALFKDSSLVSVIAMVELTKTYTILAATTLQYLELGLIVAAIYFGMSFPLSILARKWESALKGKRGR
ncbi:MAG: ABC transporter substrate-binding protein/permease [bacterium JZ-2024 1]